MVDAFKCTKQRIEIITILADDKGYTVTDFLDKLNKNEDDAGNMLIRINKMCEHGILYKNEGKSDKIARDIKFYYLKKKTEVFTKIVKCFIKEDNTECLKMFLGSTYTNLMISKYPELKSEIPQHFLIFINPNCNVSSSSLDQSHSVGPVDQTTSNEDEENVRSILSDNETSFHPSLQELFDSILGSPVYRHRINDILIDLRDICQKGLRNGSIDNSGKNKLALMLMDTVVYDMKGGTTKILDVLNESDILLYPTEVSYEVSEDIDLVNARETLFDIIEMLNVRDRPVLDKCIKFILDGLIAENERDTLIEEEERCFESFGTSPEMSHPVGMTHYRVGIWIAKDPSQKKELIDKVSELVLSSLEIKGYGIRFIAHILTSSS